MLKFAVLVCVLFYVQAQRTRPHHTRAPHHHNVFGTVHFVFEQASGEIIAMTSAHCFVEMLSMADQKLALDPVHMEQLELTMMKYIGDMSTHSKADTTTLSHQVLNHCHGKEILKLTPS